MLTTIYTVIENRLLELGLANVGPVFGPDLPLPSARPYLGEEKRLDPEPSKVRQLNWVVEVRVGHNPSVGSAQTTMLGLLDTIRNGFERWKPDRDEAVLRSWFRVTGAKATEYSDHGDMVYQVFLTCNAAPENFA